MLIISNYFNTAYGHLTIVHEPCGCYQFVVLVFCNCTLNLCEWHRIHCVDCMFNGGLWEALRPSSSHYRRASTNSFLNIFWGHLMNVN